MGGRSSCDSCERALGPLDLVPLISWLVLRGRCRSCGAAIGVRQPLVELAAALWGCVALGLSPNAAGVAGALFGWQLLALSLFDAEMLRLPHSLTLLLAGSGFAAGLLSIAPPIGDRLLGVAAGYGALALIGWTYRRMRGRQGLGGGDAPLLGAIGCWLGWQALPLSLLVASLSGLAFVLVMRGAGRGVDGSTKLPFGPFLAAGALCLWLMAHQG